MMNFILLYLISIPVFLLIDMIWLGFIARAIYEKEIGSLMGPIRWVPAIAFYLIYAYGLTFFAMHPAFVAKFVWKAALFGGIFGFVAYATYDLTNLATLKDWSLKLSIIDMLWGALLSATVSAISVAIVLHFTK